MKCSKWSNIDGARARQRDGKNLIIAASDFAEPLLHQYPSVSVGFFAELRILTSTSSSAIERVWEHKRSERHASLRRGRE